MTRFRYDEPAPPAGGVFDRYSSLVAKGLLRLQPTTTDDLDRLPEYPVPSGTDPLDALLAAREEDDR